MRGRLLAMRTSTRAIALVAALAVVLVACAPTTEDGRVAVDQLRDEITYYPAQTGATWQYLPEGARLNAPRAGIVIEGPTVVDGELWISYREIRPGFEQRSYRQLRPDGVFLHSQVRLGITSLVYDPPLKEFPAPGTLAVGTQWSGETTVKLSLTGEDGVENRRVSYVYTVVDKRSVTVPAGNIEVYVIDLTTRLLDEDGLIIDEESLQTWFTPYLGEVRLRTRHVLIETNVPQPGVGDAAGGGLPGAGNDG